MNTCVRFEVQATDDADLSIETMAGRWCLLPILDLDAPLGTGPKIAGITEFALQDAGNRYPPDDWGHNWALYCRKIRCRVCHKTAGKFSVNPTYQRNKHRLRVLIVYSHLISEDQVFKTCRKTADWDQWQKAIAEELDCIAMMDMPSIAEH